MLNTICGYGLHVYHHYRLSLLVEIWAAVQSTLFAAAIAACSKVFKPLSFRSFSAVLLHVLRGRPLLLRPLGTHVRTMRGFASLFRIPLKKKSLLFTVLRHLGTSQLAIISTSIYKMQFKIAYG